MTFSWSPRNKRVWIAGHAGMVGQALTRRLAQEECVILTAERDACDLRRQDRVEAWLDTNRPDAVIIAAATVGGIADNAARPADYLYDNLMIAANIVHAAHQADIGRLLFLGSSCIYPRDAAQPIVEDALLTGPLEESNAAYALAKIAGVKLCEAYARQHGRAYISAMPCNLYGPHDRFDAFRSHVIPALILKLHRAKLAGSGSVTLWGTGTPLREFLHVDDLADACTLLLQSYGGTGAINVGSGAERTIAQLARAVADAVGYDGEIIFDPSHADGTPRKLLDSSRLRAMGWKPSIDLAVGLRDAIEWFTKNIA